MKRKSVYKWLALIGQFFISSVSVWASFQTNNTLLTAMLIFSAVVSLLLAFSYFKSSYMMEKRIKMLENSQLSVDVNHEVLVFEEGKRL